MSQREPQHTHVAYEWKHSSPLITCRFDPQGRFLFSSAEDMSVQRWEFASGTKQADYVGHDSWVNDIAFLSDEQTMVTVGYDHNMIFWSVTADEPQPLKTVQAHAGWIRSISVSPNGELIATGGNDQLVKLWTADGQPIRELAGHDSHVYRTLFHPEGEFLLSGDLSGVVRQWEVSSGKEVRTFDAKDLHTYNGGQQVHYGGIRGMAFDPEKKYLACCGLHKATNPLGATNEPVVLLFDWESGEKIRAHVSEDVNGIAWRVIFLSNDTFVAASGGSGSFLLFWKPDQEKDFHKVKMPDNMAREMDLHPDGLHLATAHYDNTLRISRMTEKENKEENKEENKS